MLRLLPLPLYLRGYSCSSWSSAQTPNSTTRNPIVNKPQFRIASINIGSCADRNIVTPPFSNTPVYYVDQTASGHEGARKNNALQAKLNKPGARFLVRQKPHQSTSLSKIFSNSNIYRNSYLYTGDSSKSPAFLLSNKKRLLVKALSKNIFI